MNPKLLKQYQTKEIKRCLACDIISGNLKVPGGIIFETKHWTVDHSVAPLGTGTLIVKLKRHCINCSDLTVNEAKELGPVIKTTSTIIKKILKPDQIYVCMWAHASFVPGHIHFVVQPVWNKLKTKHEKSGPFLQVDMYKSDIYPKKATTLAFITKAKKIYQTF